MTPRPALRALRPVALVTVAVLGVAGCSGSSGGAHQADETKRSLTSAQADPKLSPPPAFVGIAHPLPSGRALANDPALYRTVRLTGCGRSANGWTATGTAHNPSGRSVGFRVLVLFTDHRHRDIDSATAMVEVPTTATRTWHATKSFAAPAGTQCVIRAVSARR